MKTTTSLQQYSSLIGQIITYCILREILPHWELPSVSFLQFDKDNISCGFVVLILDIDKTLSFSRKIQDSAMHTAVRGRSLH